MSFFSRVLAALVLLLMVLLATWGCLWALDGIAGIVAGAAA